MTPSRITAIATRVPALPGSRESHLVELVDPAGEPVGELTVAEAHRAPGRLHRAFSVLLNDGSGRVLLQQRAAVKTRFALRWANTCCGHPAPGQDVRQAAAIRLWDEMGLEVSDSELYEAGRFVYQASDPATGRVEHEYDHVLVATVPADVAPVPDPYEVAGWRWVDAGELRADVTARPDRYSPWLPDVARLATS